MNETVLIVVTAAALGLAIAMGLILWLVLREEQRRANARAALLAEMAVDPRDELSSDAVGDLRIADPVDDLEIVSGPESALFATAPARSPWPQRIAIAGVLAAVLGGIGVAARAWPSRHVPAATAAAPQPGRLELLSLAHTQQPEALTITGLVQNPREGAPLAKITATAMLFSADGAFVASGRTPLDLTTLRPGDESGFVITVPMAGEAAGSVARYRIGFRGEDGRIIGHVDRRESPSIARGPS